MISHLAVDINPESSGAHDIQGQLSENSASKRKTKQHQQKSIVWPRQHKDKIFKGILGLVLYPHHQQTILDGTEI